MMFPPEFQFTQGNLQNFLECRRRFYYSAIRRLAWPAVASEPVLENERHTKLGNAFHRLVQQYFLGIPAELLRKQASDETLQGWLESFLTIIPRLIGPDTGREQLFPEISLTCQIAGFRLAAKFDLLIVLPDGHLAIYDWKTSRFRTRRKFLANRMQTRLYRFLLAELGQRFTGKPVDPEQISMIYWFASDPEQLEVFPYSGRQYSEDARDIQQLILNIQALVANDTPEKAGSDFPLTTDQERCAFCIFRSLCDRGSFAGTVAELIDELGLESEESQELSEIDISLEQIAEIEF